MRKYTPLFSKIFSPLLAVSFLLSPATFPTRVLAKEIALPGDLKLNPPGTRLLRSREFNAPLVRGITIYPDNPLQFDFIVDRGDGKAIEDKLEPEALRMMKYFFATLTIPDEEMWVNLSPFEKDRIATPNLSQTELGRDMLALDYQLKQYAASLLYPQEPLGKKFWDQVYQLTREKFGTTQVPLDLANRVWIVPEGAVVYEHGNSAFVVESHLKVMLEEDYLSGQKQPVRGPVNGADSTTKPIISQIMREIIVPAIEEEVNKGENFAGLRQIYNAMILATWYKKNLRQTLLSQVYIDKGKTRGVDVDDKAVTQKIYEQYLTALKKGVYNFINEDRDPVTQAKIPRKYFSGGLTGVKDVTTVRNLSSRQLPAAFSSAVRGEFVSFTFQGVEVTPQNGQSPNSFAQRYRDALKASSPIVVKKEYNMPWAFPTAQYGRGNKEPEWHMAEAVGAVLLGLGQQYKEGEGIPVEEAVAKSVQVLKEYGITVGTNEALDIINGLRQRGLIMGSKEGAIKVGREERVFLKVSKQELALWSRDYVFIREELKSAIKAGWKEFFNLIDQYGQILEDSSYPVESRYPVLWAINTMPKELKKQVVDQLLARGTWYRKGLVDSILLMLDFEKAKTNWLSLQAPQLVGRNIYYVTPEKSLFEGGLGRVETYEGNAAHALGAAVNFMEPDYRLHKDQNGNYVPTDYTKTPMPLHDIRKINKIFTTYVNWEKVNFEAKMGFDERGIPHILIQDLARPGKAPFVNIQYLYQNQDATQVSEEDFREFFSKASLEVIRYLEMERRKELKADYKAPLVNPNDGQSLVMDTWRLLFYGEKEKIGRDKDDTTTTEEDITATYEIFREAVFSPKTHTYRNRGNMYDLGWGQERLRGAGVSDGWMWLFLRKDEGGRFILDWSSGGLRPGDGPLAVSAIQSYEVNPYDPRVRYKATTNGDKRDLTTVFFQEALSAVGNTDYENATPTEAEAAKAKAKEALQLNPQQFVLAYLGRLVYEKAGVYTLFTAENIELLVKAGIQVVIYGNEQPNDDSRTIARKLREGADRIRQLKAEKPQEYPGDFILKTRYDFDDQRKILAAADVQALPSTRHTGAAEITEYNGPATYSLVLGPSYWEGVISRLGPPVNWEKGTGSTLIPTSDTPEAYREQVMRANAKFKEQKLGAMRVEAGQTSLATKAEINAGDSLRYWSTLFEQPRESRRLRPRVAGEVEIQGIEVKTYKEGKENIVQRDGNRFHKEQHKPNGERILIEASIGLEAWDVLRGGGQKGIVPSDMVEARFVSEYGIVVPFRVKQKDDHRVVMFAQLPAGIALPLKGRVEATSGLWNVDQEINIDMVEEPASSPLAAIQASKEAPGGIDFNPTLLNLQIKRDRAGVPLSVPQQPIGNMNIEGFVPVIINVTPMMNLPLFLGVDSSPGQPVPQAQARKKISLN